jgi:DeoR family transcriptional regulator, fructose operon transcriptional repressor
MIKSVQRDLAPGRQERVRELVRSRGVARVAEIGRELGASAATIRRDLEALEGRGALRRVHGGAVSVESRLDEPLFDDKRSIAAREKHRIAVEAASMVHEGDTVYLDGGSTVLELARLLASRTDITVVTNSLRAAIELSGRGPRLILIGGELRRLSQTVVGPLTQPLLEQLHVDIAFMGTIGFALEDGMTTTDAGEAHTKKLAMARADRVVLLADSSKAGKILLARAGDLRDADVLITDPGLDAAFVRGLRKLGVEVRKV